MVKDKIKLNEFIFYIGFILFIVCNFLRNTEITFYKDLLWLISISLLVLKCTMEKYRKSEWLKYIGIAGVFFVIAFYSNNYYILGVPIALITTKNIPLKNIIYSIFIVNIVMTILTIVFSIFFGVGDISQTRVFRNDMEVITRYYFGFVHPNQLSITIFSILSCAVLLFWDKIKVKFFIISMTIIFITNYFTDSNTSLYASIAMILLTYCLKVFERKKIRVDYKIFSGIVIVIIFVSIFFMMNYGKYTIIDSINEALSSRILGSYKYWKLNGFSIFGRDIFSRLDVTFDQGITHVLLRYGIILFTIMIFCILRTFKILQKYNSYNYRYQFIITIFIFYSFFENEIYDIYRNISLYIIFYILSNFKKKDINWN